MVEKRSEAAHIYTPAEAQEMSGLTYRQVHHAVHVCKFFEPAQPAEGSGSRMGFDYADVQKLRLISHLRHLDVRDELIRMALDRVEHMADLWLLLGRDGSALTNADKLLPRMLRGKVTLVIDLAEFRDIP